MRYRAELEGVPGLERELETYGNDLDKLKNWAKDILAKYPYEQFPGAYVEIWETREECVAVCRPDPPPPKPEIKIEKEPCRYNHDALRAGSRKYTCPDCGERLRYD